MMLALTILAIISLLLAPFYKELSFLAEGDDYRYQDETGIYQLQILLAKNNIISIDEDCISYENLEGEYQLSLVNGKLLAQPGSLDFIHDVDEISFSLEDEVIYLKYQRGDREYEYPVGYYEEK